MKERIASRRLWRPFIVIAVLLGVVAALYGSYAAYAYAVSPASIQSPQLEHAHIRMQLIVDGKKINFGEDKFQQPYVKGQCNTDLSAEPIHFHDGKDQFVHIHWKGTTGGQVLKYYGANLIGGPDDSLGYRIENPFNISEVPVFGNQLPDLNQQLWVYSGSADNYTLRSTDEFLNEDFETFFGKQSNVQPNRTSLLDALFPKAYAHTSEESGHNDAGHNDITTQSGAAAPSQQDLTRLQNLLGDVVIFAQKDKPTDAQVAERFKNLVPLTDSVCGG